MNDKLLLPPGTWGPAIKLERVWLRDVEIAGATNPDKPPPAVEGAELVCKKVERQVQIKHYKNRRPDSKRPTWKWVLVDQWFARTEHPGDNYALTSADFGIDVDISCRETAVRTDV